jgi:hypothetical protein
VKVIDKERLLLKRPSNKVWEDVGQMQKQVQDLLGKNAGNDIEIKILQNLLDLIGDVCKLRFSGPEVPSQAKEQGIKASVAVNLMSSSESRRSRGISNQLSFTSELTAVSGGGPSSGTPTSEGDVGFGRASSLLVPGASIDLQTVNPADKFLDRERQTYVRAESPQSDESGSRSPSSPHATVQGTPGVGFMDRSTVTSPSAIHFPYIGDARERRLARRTDPGHSGTRPSLVTRASTSVLPTSRRYSLTILPNPAIRSSYEPFDVSDEGQSR